MAQATAPILDSTKADIPRCQLFVRFGGQSGHGSVMTLCQLVTQSRPRTAILFELLGSDGTRLGFSLSLPEQHGAEDSDFGNDEIEEGAHARRVPQVRMHKDINLRHKLGKRVYHPNELIRRVSELYRQDRHPYT